MERGNLQIEVPSQNISEGGKPSLSLSEYRLKGDEIIYVIEKKKKGLYITYYDSRYYGTIEQAINSSSKYLEIEINSNHIRYIINYTEKLYGKIIRTDNKIIGIIREGTVNLRFHVLFTVIISTYKKPTEKEAELAEKMIAEMGAYMMSMCINLIEDRYTANRNVKTVGKIIRMLYET